MTHQTIETATYLVENVPEDGVEAEGEEHSECQQKDSARRQNASTVADLFEMHAGNFSA